MNSSLIHSWHKAKICSCFIRNLAVCDVSSVPLILWSSCFFQKLFCSCQLSSLINPSIHNGYQYLSSVALVVWSQMVLNPLHVVWVVSSFYKTWFSPYLIKISVRIRHNRQAKYYKIILILCCHHSLVTLHKILLTLQSLHHTDLWMGICNI